MLNNVFCTLQSRDVGNDPNLARSQHPQSKEVMHLNHNNKLLLTMNIEVMHCIHCCIGFKINCFFFF